MIFFNWFLGRYVLGFCVVLCCHTSYSFTQIDTNKNKTQEELVNLIKRDTTDQSHEYEEALINYPVLDQQTAKQWVNAATFFYTEEQFDKSLKFLNRAITLAHKLQSTHTLSRAYSIKGHIYLREADDQKALDAYYKAIEIARKHKNIEHEILAKSGMIIVYHRTKKWDKAHKVATYLLNNINATSYANKENHARIYTTINDAFLAQESYDSVLHYANKGIALSKKLDFKEGLVDQYIKKGIVFYHKENYNKAFEFLSRAQQILEDNDVDNSFYEFLNSNYFLASCHYKLKQYDQAITYAQKNIKMSKEKDFDKIEVIQTHLLLANCYREKKNYETALHWNDLYVQMREHYEEKKDKTVDKIFEKAATELESEIATLKKEKEAEKANKKIYLILSIIISLGLIFLAIQYYRKQKSNQKLFDELLEKMAVLETEDEDVVTPEIHKLETKEVAIDDQKVGQILNKLKKLEEQEYFLKTDCNLNTIAKKIKTNTTYLSKIINIHKEKSVKDYINDLRIEYVLKKIKNDRKFRAFSIKSIANEVGYKSHTSFTKHFKSKTGINPSYYIKNIEKLEQQLRPQNT